MIILSLYWSSYKLLPASEPMLRPAPEPAARDCRAPRDAMGFTEELLLEVGDEPA